MKRILMTSISVAALLAFAGVASAQDPKIAQGEKVFADQKCSLCHSIAGKGNPKGPLDEVGSKLKAEEIRQWIVDPTAMRTKTKAERNPPMPAKFASLPKDDLDALVAYLSSLKKK
jgi:mono/diheme cytochrome c family protein